MEIQFEEFGWLWCAPVLVLFLLLITRETWRRQLLFASMYSRLSQSEKPSFGSRARSAGRVIAVVTLLLALAKPVVYSTEAALQPGSASVVAVIDVSRSMSAWEYPALRGVHKQVVSYDFILNGSRLDAVREALLTHTMRVFSRNKIGIVAFKGKANAIAELTDDADALQWIVDHWLKLGSASGAGSNYSNGVLEAVDIFTREKAQRGSTMVVLFSDGGDTSSGAERDAAIAALKVNQIELIAVGVGNGQYSQVPVDPDDPNSLFVMDKLGKPVTTVLEESDLQSFVKRAGGTYLPLNQIDKLKDTLPSTSLSRSLIRKKVQLYSFFLLFALLLCLCSF